MTRKLYPCVIISDRYCGAYSGGRWTAWHRNYDDIPEEIDSDDSDCMNFWGGNDEIVGLGDTPEESYNDLIIKKGKQSGENNIFDEWEKKLKKDYGLENNFYTSKFFRKMAWDAGFKAGLFYDL